MPVTPRVTAPLIAALLAAWTIVGTNTTEAAGQVTGDLPENGGVALVSWTGGPTDEIVQSAGSQGCALNAVWSFVGGFPYGYLVGAPDFVNTRFFTAYPSGDVPAGPLLLVCRPTLVLNPGDNLGARVAAQPPGTTFVFNPGIYRGASITARNGDTFQGQPGAILSGARVLNGFQQFQNGRWYLDGQTSELSGHGGCAPFEGRSYSGCRHPEQLFLDGEPLWQVTSANQLAPGRWYFNYDIDRVVMVDDPTGRQVELSTTPIAFKGSARNVTIDGLVIEKYANDAQRGAIHGDSGGSGWLIVDNEIRYNHGTGLRTHTDMVVRDNYVHHNGQIGVAGLGNRILIEGNEISYNGIAGFDPFWEAGGTKWVKTHDLVVRDNHVHHNLGRGIWTDIDNVDALIENNLAEFNDQGGIVHEIGYAAVIRNNVARNNGLAFDVWVWGAQILVQNSSDTVVTGNTVTVSAAGGDGIAVINQNRGSGPNGPYRSRNVTVEGNEITYLGNVGWSGVADDTSGRPACGDGYDNVFQSNTYHLGSTDTQHWFWCVPLDWSGLQAIGHESLGIAVAS
jgi:hypothetical protein